MRGQAAAWPETAPGLEIFFVWSLLGPHGSLSVVMINHGKSNLRPSTAENWKGYSIDWASSNL